MTGNAHLAAQQAILALNTLNSRPGYDHSGHPCHSRLSTKLACAESQLQTEALSSFLPRSFQQARAPDIALCDACCIR
eukprot:6173937-Amphidinium_carterae.1